MLFLLTPRISKILNLSQKVFHSPTVRAELARLARDENLKSEVLVRPVKTRWNTVCMVLERAIQLRDALTPLCVMAQFNTSASRGLRLKRFVLSDDDWTFVEQLHSLLEVRGALHLNYCRALHYLFTAILGSISKTCTALKAPYSPY